MKKDCIEIQERLAEMEGAEEGREVLRDDETLRDHLESCADCTAVLAALEGLDEELAGLAVHDAPDEVVERVLDRTREPAESESWRKQGLGWLAAAAAAAGILAAVYVPPQLYQAIERDKQKRTVSDVRAVGYATDSGVDPGASHAASSGEPREAFGGRKEQGAFAAEREEGKAPGREVRRPDVKRQAAELSPDDKRDDDRESATVDGKQTAFQAGENERSRPIPRGKAALQGTVSYEDGRPAAFSQVVAKPAMAGSEARTVLTDAEGRFRLDELEAGVWTTQPVEPGYRAESAVRATLFPGDQRRVELDLVPEDKPMEEVVVTASRDRLPNMMDTSTSHKIGDEELGRLSLINSTIQEVNEAMPGTTGDANDAAAPPSASREQDRLAEKPKEQRARDERRASHARAYRARQAQLRRRAAQAKAEGVGSAEEQRPAAEPPARPAPPPSPTPAEIFLAERERTEGLEFHSATGYWANTYLPGDPAFRLLQARLRGQDEEALPLFEGMPLHEAATPYTQPFDPPEDAALALHLHTDATHVDGPTRMLLQVGLQATERRPGRRPAMHVGVVLDLRGDLDAETERLVRELVRAFAEARDIGDRFSLVVAGRPGEVLIEPGAFRHGPAVVALRELFDDDSTTGGSTLDLPRAVRRAAEAVAASDEPEAPLGAAAIVLITPRSLEPHLEELEEIAHTTAVAGVPLSTLGVGPGADLAELEALALEGQGHRRVLTRRGDARRVVENELHASSAVVARAVRLRLRLDPEVRLVDVVGSHRLDEPEAERVRAAEQSIDRRVARSLGIRADRGEDEAGIQIVIPAFHAGDAHVILLDVVAEGPGRLLDASVRYKDLVHLKNASHRAALALGAGPSPRGPLERNVLKNLLGHRIARATREAARRVRGGDWAGARGRLQETVRLVEGLRARIEGWDRDEEITRDLAMLRGYLEAMSGSNGPENAESTADSLEAAGWRKMMETDENP